MRREKFSRLLYLNLRFQFSVQNIKIENKEGTIYVYSQYDIIDKKFHLIGDEVMEEAQDIHELPTRRFYYSFMFMMPRLRATTRGTDFFNKVYDPINTYHEESLALLRATTKLYRTSTKEEEEFEKRYIKKREEIDKLSVEDEEWHSVLASRILEEKINFYDLLVLEKNLFSVGMVVQFLSSLESTLNSLYKCLVSIDNHLLKIEDVCKRDKGIIKYIKYFEKSLITSTTPPILIGTPNYERLH